MAHRIGPRVPRALGLFDLDDEGVHVEVEAWIEDGEGSPAGLREQLPQRHVDVRGPDPAGEFTQLLKRKRSLRVPRVRGQVVEEGLTHLEHDGVAGGLRAPPTGFDYPHFSLKAAGGT